LGRRSVHTDRFPDQPNLFWNAAGGVHTLTL
jgi:hypothetical protein